MTAREEQAARSVRAMFASVARRYDFLNHLLSFNVDRSCGSEVITPDNALYGMLIPV